MVFVWAGGRDRAGAESAGLLHGHAAGHRGGQEAQGQGDRGVQAEWDHHVAHPRPIVQAPAAQT